MSYPLVSVLMPAYNAEQFLDESIPAILNQNFIDFEFIIINDGSIDKTKEKINSYRDKRIRFYENQINKGIVSTLNYGLSVANGKYIFRTDADDIAKENMILELVEFMESNSDYVACGANMQIIGAPNKSISYPSNNEELKVYTLNSCPFSHSAVIFRADVLKLHSLNYDESIKDGEDYGLWSKLLPLGKFANLPKNLLCYRESQNQITAKEIYKDNYIKAQKKIFAIHAKDYFQLSGEEIDCYVQLILGEGDGQFELIRSGQLLSKIFEGNKSNFFFDHTRLRRFFFIKWFSLCLHSKIGKAHKAIIYYKFCWRAKNFFNPLYHAFRLLL